MRITNDSARKTKRATTITMAAEIIQLMNLRIIFVQTFQLRRCSENMLFTHRSRARPRDQGTASANFMHRYLSSLAFQAENSSSVIAPRSCRPWSRSISAKGSGRTGVNVSWRVMLRQRPRPAPTAAPMAEPTMGNGSATIDRTVQNVDHARVIRQIDHVFFLQAQKKRLCRCTDAAWCCWDWFEFRVARRLSKVAHPLPGPWQ